MIQFDVMGQLGIVDDWDIFKKQLKTLKECHIRAITTPLWWGIIEQEEGKYDWTYYKKYANIVRASGLKWVPIFATHKCGTSVGDNVHISLPEWLFGKAPEEQMFFKNESGQYCDEVLSLWGERTTEYYGKFYESFSIEFIPYKDIIVQINLSTGSASELKYPSYNHGHDWKYPGRGKLQCYSESAKASFQNWLMDKYKDVSNINDAFGVKISKIQQIEMPSDGDMFL